MMVFCFPLLLKPSTAGHAYMQGKKEFKRHMRTLTLAAAVWGGQRGGHICIGGRQNSG